MAQFDEEKTSLYKQVLFNHILNACLLIDEFLGPINLFEEYVVNLKTKSAIERQLGIIGEAVKKIRDIDSAEQISHHKEIIGFRNILVHDYINVDDTVVWKIIKEHLALLKEEMLSKLD